MFIYAMRLIMIFLSERFIAIQTQKTFGNTALESQVPSKIAPVNVLSVTTFRAIPHFSSVRIVGNGNDGQIARQRRNCKKGKTRKRIYHGRLPKRRRSSRNKRPEPSNDREKKRFLIGDTTTIQTLQSDGALQSHHVEQYKTTLSDLGCMALAGIRNTGLSRVTWEQTFALVVYKRSSSIFIYRVIHSPPITTFLFFCD